MLSRSAASPALVYFISVIVPLLVIFLNPWPMHKSSPPLACGSLRLYVDIVSGKIPCLEVT